MDKQQFLNLNTASIAQIVQAQGTRVCVFPINGTRRWFMLTDPPQNGSDPLAAYLDVAGKQHIHLYKSFFDHGLTYLLTPVFGPDLLERGDAYLQVVIDGLERFVEHPDFLGFYEEYEVRVHFYGDYARFFANTPAASLTDKFRALTEKTRKYDKNRLFFGVCAQDAVTPVIDGTLAFFQTHGRAPTKDELIIQYYGECVPPVDIFIGFDKFAVFDMPMLATGEEDLYFTVAPSLDFTEGQLRQILYDHLFERRVEETDYSELTPEDWRLMQEFYRANAGKTLGVGACQTQGNYWYPLPQVEIPPEFAEHTS